MTEENQPNPSAAEPPVSSTPQPQATPPAETTPDRPSYPGRLPIGEEMDSSKWTLPPPKTLGVGLLVFVVLGIVMFLLVGRAKPVAAGTIDHLAIASPADNQVLVAINVTFSNILPEKPIWLRSASARLTKSNGEQLSDTAASFVDFERYFQAFPALKEGAIEPLRPDIKLMPGEKASGMIVVSFPVDKQTFDQRKNLAVVLDLYDQLPVTIGGK
jgi:hypothetical protein